MKKISKIPLKNPNKLNKLHNFFSKFGIGDKVNFMGLTGVVLAVRFAKNSINYDITIDGIPMYNIEGKSVKSA